MKTKKVGSTGRFGAKYGRKIKIRVRDIEVIEKARHPCPKCHAQNVKRVASGIWSCSRCGAKFAGGAYALAQKTEAQKQIVSVETYEDEKPGTPERLGTGTQIESEPLNKEEQ